MKRYIVFLYNSFYPEGGMKDFFSSYDDLNEIKNEVKIRYDESTNYAHYVTERKPNGYDSYKNEENPYDKELVCENMQILDTQTWKLFDLPAELVIEEEKHY